MNVEKSSNLEWKTEKVSKSEKLVGWLKNKNG